MPRKPIANKKTSTGYSLSETTKATIKKLKTHLNLSSDTAVIEFLVAEKARKEKIPME